VADLPELRRLAGNWFILPAGDERTSAYLAFSAALVEAWPEIEAALGYSPAKLTEATQDAVLYEQLAADLHANSVFHIGEPNPTAELMRSGAEAIRALLAESVPAGEAVGKVTSDGFSMLFGHKPLKPGTLLYAAPGHGQEEGYR